MHQAQRLVVLGGKYVLAHVGIGTCEEPEVVRSEAVEAGLHHFLGGFRGKVQIVVGVVLVLDEGSFHRTAVYDRTLGVGTGGVVVLAEGTLEEAYLGLECKGRPLVHTVGGDSGRQVFDCDVEVLDHLVDNLLAGIPRSIQRLVIGFELAVHPRNVTPFLYLDEIEVCPEETGQAFVFGAHLCVLAVLGVGKEGIDPPEAGPGPAGLDCRTGAGLLVGHRTLDDVVVELVRRGHPVDEGVVEQVVQRIGIELELGLA